MLAAANMNSKHARLRSGAECLKNVWMPGIVISASTFWLVLAFHGRSRLKSPATMTISEVALHVITSCLHLFSTSIRKESAVSCEPPPARVCVLMTVTSRPACRKVDLENIRQWYLSKLLCGTQSDIVITNDANTIVIKTIARK